MPEQPTNEQYQPLALLAVVLGALLMFAVFFIGFLVAPLAILLLFYVGFSALDRSRKNGGGGHPAPAEVAEAEEQYAAETAADRLAREAGARRAVMDRSDETAALEAERLAHPEGTIPPSPPAPPSGPTYRA